MTGIILRIVLPSVIVGAMILAVVIYITDAERAKDDLNDATTHIENRERIDDAIAPVDGCGWFDRLRSSCAE